MVGDHAGDRKETGSEEDCQNSYFSSSLAAEYLTLKKAAGIEQTEDSKGDDDATRKDMEDILKIYLNQKIHRHWIG